MSDPLLIALFGRAAMGGDGYEIEKRYLRPDGTAVWTRIQVRAIRDATGAPKYLSGVCEDMTPRKQAETQQRQPERTGPRRLRRVLHLRRKHAAAHSPGSMSR